MTDEASVKNTPTPPGEYTFTENIKAVTGLTIKEDEVNRLILLFGFCLNYTDQDQQNFAFSGPSSAGKSYISLEIAKFFPGEDLIALGYCSPTSFYHDYGSLCRENGSPLETRSEYVENALKEWYKENPKPSQRGGRTEWNEKKGFFINKVKDEWDEVPKVYIVDLEKKIIIFYDQPHPILLQRLRALLSHDEKRIQYNITDRSKDGKNRTKRIVLKGYPTVVFNSVSFLLDEQERTRFWILSPEITQNKLRKAITFSVDTQKDRRKHQESIYGNKERFALRRHIRGLKEAGIEQVIISDEDADYIKKEFFEKHNDRFRPRHQRDVPRLFSICKSFAVAQYDKRTINSNRDLIATREDIEQGLELYNKIADSNEHGLPPHIYKLWMEKLLPIITKSHIDKRDISRSYYELYQTHIGDKAIKKLVTLLLDTGLIIEETHPEDKRKKVYVPGGVGEKNGKLELEERLKLLVETAINIHHYETDGPFQEDTLLERLRENHVYEWTQDIFSKVLDIANRDGTVWRHKARPGYLGVNK